MDSTVHGVAKSWTRLNDFHFLSFHVVLRSGKSVPQRRRTLQTYQRDGGLQRGPDVEGVQARTAQEDVGMKAHLSEG